jgi:hypothetical protein
MHQCDQGGYDIIGDIHGHVTKLESLLIKLEYTKSDQGFYSHSKEWLIFLNNYPQQEYSNLC